MTEPFAIAGGAMTRVNNILVRVRLRDGTTGWGEGAPMAEYNEEDQATTLRAVRRQRGKLIGADLHAYRPVLEALDERMGVDSGAARAALSMAVLDAWARRMKTPLRILFGAASTRVYSDVTVSIVSPARALQAARAIIKRGIKTIKIKVGLDLGEDEARVAAVDSAARGLRLILDANQGYDARKSLKLLKALKRRGIRPALFEQPAAKEDWKGLKDVSRRGGVPVASDESVASRADARRMARVKAVSVVNIKIMKYGLLEAWDIALISRAAGLGLMIGGMVESSLSMTCSAHFAAGLGGFSFVDLDTPLWFKNEPTKGVRLGHRGVYDLSKVKAGIGVTPI